MNKARKIITICLAISLIISCVAFSYTAPTQLAPAQESTTSEEELQRIAELSSDKYNHLLQVWSKDPNYPSDIDANFPDFYGGVYVDDNKELVIMVTSLDNEIVNYFGDLIDLEHVRFSLAAHSFQELLDTQEAVDRYIASGENEEICSAITGTGISEDENAVNIYIKSSAPPNLTDFISKKFFSGNNPCNVQFITLDLTFGGPNDKIQDRNVDDNSLSPHIVAGVVVDPGCPLSPRDSSNPPDIPDFSAGFWAKNSEGELGIVTTFHGTSHKGRPVYAYTYDFKTKIYFGVVTQEMFSGAVDATFVRRNDPRFPPLTRVDGWDFNLKSQTKDMNKGDTVYKKAAESGVTKGTVLDTDFNPSEYSDTKLSSAVLVECVAAPGDSGGVVAGGGTTSSRYVVGILSGGGTKPTGLGGFTQVMYYSKASSILDALELTLY